MNSNDFARTSLTPLTVVFRGIVVESKNTRGSDGEHVAVPLFVIFAATNLLKGTRPF